MDTLDKISLYVGDDPPAINEGILKDLKGAFNYYIDGIMAMDAVSDKVKHLATVATKEGEGKSDEEKQKIVQDFMIKTKAVVLKSKMHASMKAGYIEGIEKSFGRKIKKA